MGDAARPDIAYVGTSGPARILLARKPEDFPAPVSVPW